MRQKQEVMLKAPKTDVPLRPFEAFYELLRNSFYIPLVAGMGALEAAHTDFLLGLKDRLLDVSFEKPLPNAEAAYEDCTIAF